MFIQTEETLDASELRFIPGVPVLDSGSLSFARGSDVSRSPLVERIFEIDEIHRADLNKDSITLAKSDGQEWLLLKPAILGIIMDYFIPPRITLADQSSTGSVLPFRLCRQPLACPLTIGHCIIPVNINHRIIITRRILSHCVPEIIIISTLINKLLELIHCYFMNVHVEGN